MILSRVWWLKNNEDRIQLLACKKVLGQRFIQNTDITRWRAVRCIAKVYSWMLWKYSPFSLFTRAHKITNVSQSCNWRIRKLRFSRFSHTKPLIVSSSNVQLPRPSWNFGPLSLLCQVMTFFQHSKLWVENEGEWEGEEAHSSLESELIECNGRHEIESEL